MKNVLIIIGKLSVGGAERIGRDIGYYADKQKYNIHYLVFENDIGAYEKELMDAGCTIHHMDPPANGYFKYYKNLCKIIRKEHINIIHSHTMFNSGWAMMAGKYQGVATRISHSHSIKGPEHRGFIKNLYEKTMRKVIQHCATDYVACGKGAGEWLYGKKFFGKYGTVIYNGIGLDQFIYNENSRSKIRDQYAIQDKFVIGHVGHLAPVKNQSFLLELLPDILKKRPEAVVLLLGDGQDRQMLEDKIHKMKLEDKVLMTGNVKNVGDYMSAMDVFVFPSLYEGMPLALVEAQSNGLPCIISKYIPDDIHLTDLICTISLGDSKEQWVKCITEVKRKMPKAYGRIMYELGFDIPGMLEKIYRLYEKSN